MAKSPVFCTKRKLELLQSRSAFTVAVGQRPLKSVEKSTPGTPRRQTGAPRWGDALQKCSKTLGAALQQNYVVPAFSQGEIEFPGAFGHTSQPYLKSRFVKSPFYNDEICYSCASIATL
jgi:hypothetical protein